MCIKGDELVDVKKLNDKDFKLNQEPPTSSIGTRTREFMKKSMPGEKINSVCDSIRKVYKTAVIYCTRNYHREMNC